MKQIVIISRSEAIRHLRSLDPGEIIDLEGPGAARETIAESAIGLIVGQDARGWAAEKKHLRWTVRDLLQEFGPQRGDRVKIVTRGDALGTVERIDSLDEYEVSIDGGNVVVAMRDDLEIVPASTL